jgi:hypothetical protein
MIALRAKIIVCASVHYIGVIPQAKLEAVEHDIAENEFQYLEETDHGNIVKGFEGYVFGSLDNSSLDFFTFDLVHKTGKREYDQKIEYSVGARLPARCQRRKKPHFKLPRVL